MHFFSKINNNIFFRFDRDMVKNKIWCNLPLASRAVYPVIGIFCNADGIAFPSELTLAVLCGMWPKTIRQGIRNLRSVPGFTASHYVNSHGKNAHKYKINPVPKAKGRYFPFFRSIVDGGNWSQTSESGKALYVAMRYYGFYIQDDDNTVGNPGEFIEDFKARKYELCEAEPHNLQELSGLSRPAYYSGLRSLEEAQLLKRVDGIWRITIRPDKVFRPDFLNSEARKYQCEEKNAL